MLSIDLLQHKWKFGRMRNVVWNKSKWNNPS